MLAKEQPTTTFKFWLSFQKNMLSTYEENMLKDDISMKLFPILVIFLPSSKKLKILIFSLEGRE